MVAGKLQRSRCRVGLLALWLLGSIGALPALYCHARTSAESTEMAGALRYHAILIGSATLDKASTHEAIATTMRAMELLLREKYGFQTHMLLGQDASVPSIESALREKVKALSDHDLLLIVYAGRTERDPFLNESYWVTASEKGDWEPQSWAQHRFPGSRVLKYIAAMHARHVLLVHEGGFEWNQTRGVNLVAKRSFHPEQWYVRAVEQPSRMFLTRPLSTDAESLRLLPGLVNLLESSESLLISSSELFLQYRDRTGDGQVQFGRLHDGKGSLQGEFVFNSRATATGESAADEAAMGELKPHPGRMKMPAPVHMPIPVLYVDPDASVTDGLQIENLGCQHTADSIAGEAIRFERRGYLRVRAPWFRDLAAGDFTVAFWMKSELAIRFPLLSLSKLDRGVAVYCNGAGFLSFSSKGPARSSHWGTADSLEPIRPHRWYHLVFTKSGNRLSVAVDGILQSSLVREYTTFSDNSDQLHIGSLSNAEGSRDSFEGVLDELQVFDRALGPEQVRHLYEVKYQRFVVSPLVKFDGQDLDRIAQQYYGGGATVAEWTTLEPLFAQEGEAFLKAMGLDEGEMVRVRVDGQLFDSNGRAMGIRREVQSSDSGISLNPDVESGPLAISSMDEARGRFLIQKY